jgi:hypothetical protein
MPSVGRMQSLGMLKEVVHIVILSFKALIAALHKAEQPVLHSELLSPWEKCTWYLSSLMWTRDLCLLEIKLAH